MAKTVVDLCNSCENKPICKYCKVCNDTIKEIDAIKNANATIIEGDGKSAMFLISALMCIDVSCNYYKRTHCESNVRSE